MPEGLDVLGIRFQDGRELRARLVKIAVGQVEAPQRVLHVRAIGKSLGQVLESRDGLLVVFHEVCVVGFDEVSLRQWKLLAEFESFAGGLLRLGVIAERRVGFGQPRIGQGKLRVLLNGGLEYFDCLHILAFTQQLHTLTEIAERGNGF